MGFMDTIEAIVDFLDLLEFLFHPFYYLFKRDSRSPFEDIPLPKADLTNIPPENHPFSNKAEPSIWAQMGVDE